MRDIQFRGKRLDNGKWAHGALDNSSSEAAYICHYEEEDKASIVNSATVGQYTGLKDFKGREIYEGDILTDTPCKILDQPNEVKWFAEHAAFGLYRPDRDTIFPISPGLEIIGNIYDNSELMR